MAPNVEITLEANPTSVEAENFRGYRAAGMNRVSVGVQALDGARPKRWAASTASMKRWPPIAWPQRFFRGVLRHDLCAARSDTKNGKHELTRALANSKAICRSTSSPSSPTLPISDLQAEERSSVPRMKAPRPCLKSRRRHRESTGLTAYEVSNHAREGPESRHNLHYWRYGEYAGVGPGAHARIAEGENRRAIVMEKYPETWRKLVTEKGHGIVEDTIVLPADQASEYLIMGLRVSDGIDLTRYEKLRGQSVDPNKIAGLKSLGLVRREGPRLMATTQGRRLLNALITELAN